MVRYKAEMLDIGIVEHHSPRWRMLEAVFNVP
jgi:hypothetical protein